MRTARVATDLVRRGHPDALDWTPRQVAWAAGCAADADEDDLTARAVAARIAQADEKGWKEFARGR